MFLGPCLTAPRRNERDPDPRISMHDSTIEIRRSDDLEHDRSVRSIRAQRMFGNFGRNRRKGRRRDANPKVTKRDVRVGNARPGLLSICLPVTFPYIIGVPPFSNTPTPATPTLLLPPRSPTTLSTFRLPGNLPRVPAANTRHLLDQPTPRPTNELSNPPPSLSLSDREFVRSFRFLFEISKYIDSGITRTGPLCSRTSLCTGKD